MPQLLIVDDILGVGSVILSVVVNIVTNSQLKHNDIMMLSLFSLGDHKHVLSVNDTIDVNYLVYVRKR